MTVRVIVAVCESDPEVAVTVTVEVVLDPPPVPPPPPPPLLLPEPPPQPPSQPMPKTQTVRISSLCRVRRRRKPKKESATANVAPPGSSGLRLGHRLALAEVVAIVRVVVAALPVGITVDGEKLQVPPVGRPVQAKETAAEKPFWGVMVIVEVPLDPAVTVSEVGLAPTLKSGVGKLIV